jgi:glycosyltransferase involved in cell wall biosynthesis
MRIAQIAPLTESIPPKLYGGTERVVSWLTEELVALGHEVTLFASGDSKTSAELDAIWPTALRLDPAIRDPNALHMAMLEHVCQRGPEFDVMHFHLDYYPFSLFTRQPVPWVTTLHGRLDLNEHQTVFRSFPTASVISISDAQRKPVPYANWVRTIHHGLPAQSLQPKPTTPSYLAFLGRICPEKAPDVAISIARRCGLPLKIAAKVDKADVEYYETRIKPLLGAPGIEFVGEISDAQKADFLSGAIALLMPISWPEPFGLVMIEAAACGTPVIAYNAGSVSEIIEDGVTGFIVSDENSAIKAIEKIPALDRRLIRQRFDERFTARRMAQDYLAVYAQLMESEAPKLRVVS